MDLEASQLKWVRRLTRTQGAKEELIKLLGLINLVCGLTAREASLSVAAAYITQRLANYLLLEHCSLFIIDHCQRDGTQCSRVLPGH